MILNKFFLVDFINVVSDSNKSKVTTAVEISFQSLLLVKEMPVSMSSY